MNFQLKNLYRFEILMLMLLIALSLALFKGTVLPIGLDNYSPIFYPLSSLQNLDTSIASARFPLLPYALFWEAMSGIGLSVVQVSYVLKTSGFLFAGIGIYLLVKTLSAQIDDLNVSEERAGKFTNIFFPTNREIVGSIATIMYLFSIVSFWIFFEFNLIFFSLFITIPWVLYFVFSKQSILNLSIPIIIVGILISITALNPLVFLLYPVLVIALVIANKVLFGFQEKLLQYVRRGLAVFLIATVTLTVSFFYIMTVNGFAVTQLTGAYVQSYRGYMDSNKIQQTVTESLQDSERASSIIDSIGHTTAWTKMSFPDGEKLIDIDDGFFNKVLPFISLLLLILGVWYVNNPFNNKDKNQQTNSKSSLLPISLLYLFGIFLSSRYIIELVAGVPIVENLFRWPSSKFWPIVLLPTIFIFTFVYIKLSVNEARRWIAYIFAFMIVSTTFLTSLPYFSTLSSAEKFAPKAIPEEYFDLRAELANKSVLYLPAPQALYFRLYDFGDDYGSYYGSDFVSYIWTETEVIDVAHNLSQQSIYEEKYNEFCDSRPTVYTEVGKLLIYETDINGVDLVIWDKYAGDEICNSRL